VQSKTLKITALKTVVCQFLYGCEMSVTVREACNCLLSVSFS
jgi:hypothetical protein